MNKPTTFLFWLVAGLVMAFIYVYLALTAGIAGFPYGWHEAVFNVAVVIGLLSLLAGVVAAGFAYLQKLRVLSFRIGVLIALGLVVYTLWGAQYFTNLKHHNREMTLKNSLYERATHMLDCTDGYKVAYVHEPFGSEGRERQWLLLIPPGKNEPALFLAKRLSGEKLWVSNRETGLMPLLNTCNSNAEDLTYLSLRDNLNAN